MSEPRLIKRYTNRKLYDTKESRYVTLSQIATMVRAGEELQVIDNATKEDLTSLTLAQIIYEQERRRSEMLPISALRELIRRSEARLADLREGPVGRLLGRGDEEDREESADQVTSGRKADASDEASAGPESDLETSKIRFFDEWQRRVDERLRALLDTVAPFRQLQEELKGVTERIEELEGRLRRLSRTKRPNEPSPPEASPEE